MNDEAHSGGSLLSAVSNAMVSLHKEQFGRGPTEARSGFAHPDVLVTVLSNALLPAEKALVSMGEPLRVMEARAFFQEATRDRFIQTVEEIVRRKVHAYHSSCDPRAGIVIEVAIFEPDESGSEDNGTLSAERARELGEDGQLGG
jgi:uncharacterized protein YbcI